MKRIKQIMVAVCVVVMAGCVSVTEQAVPVSSKYSIRPGNALIIVERKQERNARAHAVEVTDNGKTIGLLGVGIGKRNNRSRHQLVWQRPAGTMILKLTPSMIVSDENTVTERVRAGKTYTFTVGFKMWPYGLTFLED